MKEIIVRRVEAKVEFGAGATCAFGQLLKKPRFAEMYNSSYLISRASNLGFAHE